MKVQYEDVKKLKQLDRIDFLLQRQLVEESNDSYIGGLVEEAYHLLYLVLWFSLALPIWVMAFGLRNILGSVLILFFFFRIYFEVFIVIGIVCVILTVVCKINYNKKKKALLKEFFSTEAKNGKRKE